VPSFIHVVSVFWAILPLILNLPKFLPGWLHCSMVGTGSFSMELDVLQPDSLLVLLQPS
jgi:hypothetical protein